MCREVMWTVDPPLMQYAVDDKFTVCVHLNEQDHTGLIKALSDIPSARSFLTLGRSYGPLEAGDVIESINGIPSYNPQVFQQILAARPSSRLRIMKEPASTRPPEAARLKPACDETALIIDGRPSFKERVRSMLSWVRSVSHASPDTPDDVRMAEVPLRS